MKAAKLTGVSIKEYIAIEKAENVKYEYHNGSIYAMVGGSINHGLICGNIYFELESKLRLGDKPCQTLNTEMKVKINAESRYVYPDASVVCGELELSDNKPDSVMNPTVIVEVLSKSTSDYDRSGKFYFYRQIKSLKEYILIEQNFAKIEIFKKKGGLWYISEVITNLDSELFISSLNITIDLKNIYRKVTFPNEGEKHPLI